MTIQENCIQAEMEYREWRESPQWYCVKTIFHNNGALECEVVVDETSNIPVAIQSIEKPLDGVFEGVNKTTYYTYHQGYEAAAQYIAAVKR